MNLHQGMVGVQCSQYLKAEVGRSLCVQGQCGLNSEFQISLMETLS